MLRRLAQTTVLSLIAFAVGASPTKAAEIDFGALTPTPGCAASTNGSDTGLICANSQTFTANGSTFTATGFSDAFTTPSALTLKPLTSPPGPPTNSLGESGLGENAVEATQCTDASVATNCEIANPASVAVVSDNPITDIIVGSAQAGENFNFFTGSSIATLSQVGGTIVGGSCTAGPVAETCLITGFSALAVGIQSAGVGNVLLTAVSQPSVPEPATLALLGTALAGFGWVRRRRRPSAAV